MSLEKYCTQGEEGTESFVFRLIFDLFHLLVLVFLIWMGRGHDLNKSEDMGVKVTYKLLF